MIIAPSEGDKPFRLKHKEDELLVFEYFINNDIGYVWRVLRDSIIGLNRQTEFVYKLDKIEMILELL